MAHALISRLVCKVNIQVSNFKCTFVRIGVISAVALIGVSIWGASSVAQQRCDNVFSDAPVANQLLGFSGQHFDYFMLGTLAKSEPGWWHQAIESAASRDSEALRRLFKKLPNDLEVGRADRLLMIASDNGVKIPDELYNQMTRKIQQRESLRADDINVAGDLTAGQKKDLTNMFTMLGIRRSKAERLFERLKNKVGMESAEYIPVIQAHKAENILGDEARLVLSRYNKAVTENPADVKEIYKSMMEDLFKIYSQRVYMPLNEPWFMVGGKAMNLSDFVNSGAYRQQEVAANNTWMNVVRLTPDKVQNPMFKGHVREMWWNRLDSVNPIGSVRISRNMLVDAAGNEKVVSVEVLRRGDDGIFVPYLFEADIEGRLQAKETREASQKLKACFQCHLRLSGVLFGGITMPNYKAVNDWHINNIDFTKRTSYEKFKEFR